ncbi:MAG: hypothetical protein E6I75_04205 [Chloroflexi bacterium]|nr:MAG: hypothetical protein E6I75_04205 [Chloroflexota bacterium]
MPQPLDAHVERLQDGWSIRVPLRREQITVHKRLRPLANRPDLEATQPLSGPAHHDTLAGTGMDQDPLH